MNVLANQISRNYPEWHRYMKTFGTIVMSRVAFNLTIDDLDEKSLTSLAVKIGERAPENLFYLNPKILMRIMLPDS